MSNISRNLIFTTMTMSGGTIHNISKNTEIKNFTMTGGTITTINGTKIDNMTMTGGTITKIEQNGTSDTIGTLTVKSGAEINSVNMKVTNLTIEGGTVNSVTGQVQTLEVKSGTLANVPTNVTTLKMQQNGTIANFELTNSNKDKLAGLEGGTISTLKIGGDVSLTLASKAEEWNKATGSNCGNTIGQHLCVKPKVTNLDTSANEITIIRGPGSDLAIYKYEKVLIDDIGSNSTSASGSGTTSKVKFENLKGGAGVMLYDIKGEGFSMHANAATSLGANMLQNVVINVNRRNVMLGNVLDSLNFHHFYRTGIKRKNVDKEAQTDSKGQEIDTSKWQSKRMFFIPYGSYAKGETSSASMRSLAGGAILGVHKDLRGFGIASVYLGYENTNTDSTLPTATSTLVGNTLQAGFTHIMSASVFSFLQIYAKSNARANFTHFKLNAMEAIYNYDASALGYSVGGQGLLGLAIYLGKTAYIAPEAGINYDQLGLLQFELDKHILGKEYYPTHNLMLPQASASIKYYQAIGQFWRFSILAGYRQALSGDPTFHFTNNILSDSAKIHLPTYYANVNVNITRAISRVSELGLDANTVRYDGGEIHALSLKYVRWF